MCVVYLETENPIEFVLSAILKEHKKEDRLSYQLFVTIMYPFSNNSKNLAINMSRAVIAKIKWYQWSQSN